MKTMNQNKINHEIWLLANAIQNLSCVNGSTEPYSWIKGAIEDIEDVLKDLKEELPF